MSEFTVNVYKISIEPHPNADAIELAKIGEYRSIVMKDQYSDGDLVAYIPSGALLPKNILEKLNLWDYQKDKGKLAGKQGTRLKEIKLRGILSEGLIYPLEFRKGVVNKNTNAIEDVWVVPHPGSTSGAGMIVHEGDDIAEFLNITKYEPDIPVCMGGEVFNAFGQTISYDIENYKKFPEVLVDGEEVVMTEKIHGTWCCLGYHPDVTHPIVTSKGLSKKGLAFKFNEANANNLYIKALSNTTVDGDDVVTRERRNLPGITPFYILGEIFGSGVQDLTYGQSKKSFRVFDIYVGEPGKGRYLDFGELEKKCNELGLPLVPVLYKGPFSVAALKEHTNGNTTINGHHTREGIVIKPTTERRDELIGRVILKSVSEKYLLRKGGTEFN